MFEGRSRNAHLAKWTASIGLSAFVLLWAVGSRAWAHGDPSDDGLIEGGGNPATDCVAKFETGIELNYPGGTKPPKELRCTDGDAQCDGDGAVNGSCTFRVGLCLADDEEMAECVPAGIPAGGVVIKNKPLGHPKHDDGLADLQARADALLGVGGLPCDNPGAGGGNCFQCTAGRADLVAPLAQKSGKKTLKVKVTTEPTGTKNKAIKDSDKLKMRCMPCESPSTFAHIADIVFQGGCSAASVCHGGTVPQAGLNLDAAAIGLQAVYDELVTDDPTSPGAAALGLRRIEPGDTGLGTSATRSLLYEKLLRTNSELDQLCTDGGQAAQCLGGHMPPGSDGFSTGKLELLRTWIEAGAPFDGWVDGATCGEPQDPWAAETPPPAPAPGEGFQLHMPQPDGFFLEPQDEFEGCWWLQIPDTVTDTWYIDRVELVANLGTHHIILFSDAPDAGPTATPLPFDPDDTACGRHFGIKKTLLFTQDPTFAMQLPPNTGFVVQPGEVFGVNPHYVNHYNVDIYPEIWVNFYGSTTPSTAEVGSLIVGPLAFSVPPGSIGRSAITPYTNNTGNGQCHFSLTTHQHRRGTGMKIWSAQPTDWDDDTDLLIYSTDWDHPGWLQPQPRRYVPSTGKLWAQCEWDNGVLNDVTKRCQLPSEGEGPDQCGLLNEYVCFSDADCPAGETTGLCRPCDLNFGLLSEDEMCFILAYYYPEQPGPDPCPW